jgi:hypothetical protein
VKPSQVSQLVARGTEKTGFFRPETGITFFLTLHIKPRGFDRNSSKSNATARVSQNTATSMKLMSIHRSVDQENDTQARASVQHLDQQGLADRWVLSPRTLEQWRWQGRGPRFLKLGGRVIYPMSEIEAFEAANLHANTVAALPGTANPGDFNDQR